MQANKNTRLRGILQKCEPRSLSTLPDAGCSPGPVLRLTAANRSFTVSSLLRRSAAPWHSVAAARPTPALYSARAFSSSPYRPDITSDWVKNKVFGQPNPKPSAGNAGTSVAPSQKPPQEPNPAIWNWTGGLDRTELSALLHDSDPTAPLRNTMPKRPRFKQTVRLAPSTGRTVHLTPNTDAGSALRILNTRVRQNGLPKLVRLQRAHERPGLKRKRLKSERWRARFRESFLSTVSRVQELTKQGW
ncbi:hypothetical protein BROUX41_006598 [Berkeleyomyces rouxiae]|uniref:uncharacterized protein n=1 Tax=Berkeleyomyces rouxiae TaxID=2035830 RepID=UPI003B7F2BC7